MILVPRKPQEIMYAHGLQWPRCAWFADMGLGKTTSGLLLLQALELVESGATLVVGPKRVAQQVWPAEVAKWDNFSGMRIVPIVGSPENRRRLLLNRPHADIYTINYELLPWLIEFCLEQRRWPFNKVFCDEATRLKNFRLRAGGKRSMALAKAAHGKHVKHWINLTGTPSPNGLLDLWGQLWFLDGGLRLGRTFTSYRERWFGLQYDGTTVPVSGAQKQIEFQIKDMCIALRAKDYLDVRDPVQVPVPVELPGKAMDMYRKFERQMFAELESKKHIEAVTASAVTLKCLQIASGAVYVTDDMGGSTPEWEHIHNAKIEALDSILTECAGAPLIVAYHFKHDLARLCRAFPFARHLDHDPATITDWNAGKIRLLIAHPASAGHGLNLQDGGHRLAFFSHWWDLEQYQQIIERIGPVRQLQSGYDRPVYIYNIFAKDTVDEMVIARRESKRAVQDVLKEALSKRG